MVTEIDDIIIAKLHGEVLSPEEEARFEEWYRIPGNKKRYYQWQQLDSAIYANAKIPVVESRKAWAHVSRRRQPVGLIDRLLPYAAAAVVLLCVGISFHLLHHQRPAMPLADQVVVESGKRQAVLTLSTGEQIPLSDSLQQTVARENGTIIRNNAPQMLEYAKMESSREMTYNTIYIPRGGEYRLILSDGSAVWLNSESRLTFPVAFNGNSRELQLEGEAFFEVAQDNDRPFIVHTRQFDIRVTGTQFNVRTYPNEPESATLAEGHIQLERGKEVHKLTRGQQAVVGEQQITVRQVNLEEALAWRYEAFCFKQCRLENIMNELSRWYDVDVFYLNPGLKDLHFTAWFHRSSSITEVIQILEKTQKIKLELKGKTMTIRAFGSI